MDKIHEAAVLSGVQQRLSSSAHGLPNIRSIVRSISFAVNSIAEEYPVALCCVLGDESRNRGIIYTNLSDSLLIKTINNYIYGTIVPLKHTVGLGVDLDLLNTNKQHAFYPHLEFEILALIAVKRKS